MRKIGCHFRQINFDHSLEKFPIRKFPQVWPTKSQPLEKNADFPKVQRTINLNYSIIELSLTKSPNNGSARNCVHPHSTEVSREFRVLKSDPNQVREYSRRDGRETEIYSFIIIPR